MISTIFFAECLDKRQFCLYLKVVAHERHKRCRWLFFQQRCSRTCNACHLALNVSRTLANPPEQPANSDGNSTNPQEYSENPEEHSVSPEGNSTNPIGSFVNPEEPVAIPEENSAHPEQPEDSRGESFVQSKPFDPSLPYKALSH